MSRVWDLIVVGAGPTGIAIGAEARRAGLDALLIDRGPLTANLLEFPTFMQFFTTRDRLEVAGVPFAVPEAHPSLRQALVYYRAVARQFDLRLALHEEVLAATRRDDGFVVRTQAAGGPRERRARAVVLATGYFRTPKTLGVPGEELPWVQHRYRDPYRHFGERVVVVGGGNSAAEAALELWRAGVEVTVVHRGEQVRDSVKYWLRPDFDNRVREGSIRARYGRRVRAFEESHGVLLDGAGGAAPEAVPADIALVLIGYRPDAELLRGCGVQVDEASLVPSYDPESCETNVPGLYVAGTLQSGLDTHRIFIDNSREHAPRIVEHIRRQVSAVV
ncbi:MAG: YpdA family putative bacillithiol disulfide reductase [Thermoanaerobaculia bacterium]